MNSDFSPEAFGLAWQRFMEIVSAATPPAVPPEPALLDRLIGFLQAEPTSLIIIREMMLERDLPNLQVAMEHYLQGPERSAELVGYKVEHDQPGLGLSTILVRRTWQVVTEG